MTLFSWTQLLYFRWRFFWRRPNFFGEHFEGFWRKAVILVQIYFLDTLEIPGVLAVHSFRFNDPDGIL